MKKNLILIFAIILAAHFQGIGVPTRNACANYYLFSYITGQGYTQASVQNESKAHWGTGTLISSPDDFPIGCDRIDDLACQIIVPEASTVVDLSGDRILKTSGTDAVSITAALGSCPNKYYVSGGTNVTDKRNHMCIN